MRRLCVIIILCPFLSFSQKPNESIQYYANGNIKAVLREIDDKVSEYIEYFKNGHIKDSVRLRDEIPIGQRTLYADNGNLRYQINYINGLREYEFKKYRSNGTLKLTGGINNYKAFGPHTLYNKRGEVIRFQDMNKGKIVRVPYKYRNGRHLAGLDTEERFTFNKAYLHRSNHKSKKIKSGALISMKLKADSSPKHHFQIEGFSRDSILISCFSYDLSNNRKTLKYDSTFVLDFSEIETIFFAKNHNELAEFVAMAVSITGLVWVLDPLILVSIFSGPAALLEPVTLGFMLSGANLFIFGKHLYKFMVPKPYNLGEWNLTVVK